MAEVLAFLAKALVEYPDQVTVTEKRTGTQLVLELRVHPDDMGRVIGRQGRIAKSLRSVMRAVGERKGERVMVEIV